ncbi:TRAP transporter large permease subunit [Geomicrobium sp. JCM 19038]|uniref:TRAP transporter large permease subunit n=1 Tax=Geomicrobium sp. JCM 19038 TaxID=1460635 RepID=UPI0027D8BBA2|nr:TRAP transporter large permease subunit [Geomicrobium sp. JCM 19038]
MASLHRRRQEPSGNRCIVVIDHYEKDEHQTINPSFRRVNETVRYDFFNFDRADLFSQFLAISRIPTEVTSFVNQLDWSPIMIMIMILLVLLVLGLFLEGIAILVLTLPVIYPIVMELGFDGIWFGIMMVMVINIGLITPPLGISVYIISGVMKDIKIERIFKAVIPMVAAMLVAVILFILFPELITFVPNLMTGGG